MTLKNLILFGENGRLGKTITRCAKKDCKVRGVDSRKTFDEELLKTASVFLDVSLQPSLQKNITLALQHKKPLVIGTTHLTKADEKFMQEASQKIPIFYAANFSLGLTLLREMVKKVSEHLPEASIDIIDTHHKHKKDAPSGSALSIQKLVKNANIHSIRAGEVIGSHSALFHTETEKIELSHTAFSREAYAKGALLAAQFIQFQKPGLYHMEDLICK